MIQYTFAVAHGEAYDSNRGQRQSVQGLRYGAETKMTQKYGITWSAGGRSRPQEPPETKAFTRLLVGQYNLALSGVAFLTFSTDRVDPAAARPARHWGYLGICIFLNVYARGVLVVIEISGGIIHFAFFVATVVTLAIMGFDGVLHPSQEMKNAPKKVPISMVLGVVINTVIAFGFVLTLLFFIGDVERVGTTTTGYPVIELYYQATGSKAGATVLTCFVIIPAEACQFNLFASVIRLVWAFASDSGLPFSNLFSYVHPTLRIPTRALCLVGVICVLISLITAGSTAAFFAIISLNALALYISYLIPILLVLLRKLQGQHTPYGPFKFGRFGIPINIYAVCWCVFVCTWLLFPVMVPVTVDTLNCSGPIMGAIIVFVLAAWFISGHKRFRVPTNPNDD
ncbi:hypothetical protein W97_08626 [Coniosporium apollinis CBS 100218]|uniref:Amino acid permease/ SLC12A domain-containing protein n=1 Tax=Coniosporium apollinis (strain CBS 100218) TaxID=1168221 RepID=R7Z602_CONA1|nr:uncharacterized protein W97_08626 [Coniosporium apollinis CBS 100218]EON69366.1 hypothetical protein W97_08626 [Coniosporium apollinis CBS 100218]